MPVTADYDRAVAAVRKWLAECERADRLSRRYGNGKFVAKVGEAAIRAGTAHREAVIALSCLQFGRLEVDGVEFTVRPGDDGESYVEARGSIR